ncbi:hypothetical protein HMI49_25235 [Corallococcus exercitus]|uniref:Tetratricopeptide repeat protein n=1 Tax=Corallococcus exercitus TaxID=2316736 RepID=A0A7Y4NU51_9BACT|nr:hypothetical protein [Corallococcus exercitus]NOK36516.1 hypothetical protein [Corallococcus exercitus]
MTNDITNTILAELPAGEWANVQILNQPPGMMSLNNWAILAKAKWLRRGGKAAFIKFIIPARIGAGPNTLLVTSHKRLASLHQRLVKLQALGPSIPLVPLLELKLSAKGLLIAMEEVTPLHDCIERGESYDLSLKILQDLDPALSSTPWMHFDICPQNIGITPNGRCTLIDVESFYLESTHRYNVTVPAWKSFRAPYFLAEEVDIGLSAPHEEDEGFFPAELASRKINFEIALTAAECVLGPLPPNRGNITESLVINWANKASSSDPAVSFWKRELLKMVNTRTIPPIATLAQELDTALKAAQPQVAHAPRLTPAPPTSQNIHIPSSDKSNEPAHPKDNTTIDWERDWLLVQPIAHALRTGKLERAQVSEYRRSLELLLEKHPTRRELWNELLLVAISYQKDASGALRIAHEALQNIPNDTELMRQRNIIHSWARDHHNEPSR